LYSLQVMRESGCRWDEPDLKELCDAFDFQRKSGGKLLIRNPNNIRGITSSAWR
jgi:hypothetical protein